MKFENSALLSPADGLSVFMLPLSGIVRTTIAPCRKRVLNRLHSLIYDKNVRLNIQGSSL